MLYLILILMLVGMGTIGYLTYTKYQKADVAERPKILAIGGVALMLLATVLKSFVGA